MGDTEVWEACDDSWKSGIEAIHTQLVSIMKSYDVEKFGAPGDNFDPNIHEAVSVDEVTKAEPDKVISVLQAGYIKNGELLRPAKVILSK